MTKGSLPVALAVIAHLGSASSAWAFSVQDLARQCGPATGNAGSNVTVEEVREGHFCLGIILGAWSVMNYNCMDAEQGYSPHPVLLAGDMPSLAAGAQAFLNFARENPSLWGDPAMGSVSIALSQAFPCER